MASSGSSGGASKVYRDVGLLGSSIGSLALKEDRVEWRDVSGKHVKEYMKNDMVALNWTVFGQKGFLKMSLKGDKVAKFDGLLKDDFEPLKDFFSKNFELQLTKEKVGFNLNEMLVIFPGNCALLTADVALTNHSLSHSRCGHSG